MASCQIKNNITICPIAITRNFGYYMILKILRSIFIFIASPYLFILGSPTPFLAILHSRISHSVRNNALFLLFMFSILPEYSMMNMSQWFKVEAQERGAVEIIWVTLVLLGEWRWEVHLGSHLAVLES